MDSRTAALKIRPITAGTTPARKSCAFEPPLILSYWRHMMNIKTNAGRNSAKVAVRALGSRIRELQHLRTALRKTIDDWDRRLAKTPSGKRAALLESLAEARPSISRQLSPLLAPALRRKLNQRPDANG